MGFEPKIIFDNQPDIGYIETVLLNLLAKQEGWDREFKVTAMLKKEYQGGCQNDVQRDSTGEGRGIGEGSPSRV